MRRLLVLALLLTAVSCSGSGESPEPTRYERTEGELGVEIDASVTLQYLPFCMIEGAAVGKWADSASEARSAASDHEGKHPCCQCTLLWRQRP